MPALITTSPSGDEEEAREIARRFGLGYAARGHRLIEELLALADGSPVLVLSARSAELFSTGRDEQGAVRLIRRRATLGMALMRLAHVLEDEPDSLLRAAGLRPGEIVLDATLGLGGDALLAAHATGAPVLAFEKAPILAAFTLAALRRPSGKGRLAQAARVAGARIEVRAGDHREALSAMPDKSADVVLFDPMFRAPIDAAPVFDVVRDYAEMAQLTAETLTQARRVARRGVLIKDSPRGTELRRLGVTNLYARRFLFGWVDAM